MNDKLRAFICGAGSAVCAWTVLTLADVFDEYFLDVNTFLSSVVFCLIPFLLLFLYSRHVKKEEPKTGRLLLWFAGYYAAFVPLWIVIFDAVDNKRFFIRQTPRGAFLDFNGMEYMFYGVTALAAFTLFCLIYHLVRFIRKKRA